MTIRLFNKIIETEVSNWLLLKMMKKSQAMMKKSNKDRRSILKLRDQVAGNNLKVNKEKIHCLDKLLIKHKHCSNQLLDLFKINMLKLRNTFFKNSLMKKSSLYQVITIKLLIVRAEVKKEVSHQETNRKWVNLNKKTNNIHHLTR